METGTDKFDIYMDSEILQNLSNRAARIVTDSSYDTLEASLIKKLKWPTILQIIRWLLWFTNQLTASRRLTSQCL